MHLLDWPLYIAFWLIVLAMVPFVLRKHRGTAALAWLLVLFMLPYVGIILFILLGEMRLGSKRTRRFAEARRVIETTAHRGMHAAHIVKPRIKAESRDLVRLAERLSNMPVLGGNSVQMLSTAQDMIESLVKEIDKAREHVHLLYYIFAYDEAGKKVVEALGRAVERGVVCRVLVDDAGSKFTFKDAERRLKELGVKARRLLPVNFARLFLARIDVRNHRKLAVIDGVTAYVGSQNIIYARVGRKRRHQWRDLSIRVTGPAVTALQTVFAEDWYAETLEKLDGEHIYPAPTSTSGSAVQIAPSGPTYATEAFGHLIVAAIHEAHEHITVTTPYFIPDDATLQALRIAALRGVRVEVVMPKKSDNRLVDAASRAFFTPLMEVGVTVHLHQVGMLHAKMLTVDDSFVLMGSGNLDIRSFALNYELNVLLYGPKVTEQFRLQQEEYIEESRQVDPEEWAKRSGPRLMLDAVANLMSPLL